MKIKEKTLAVEIFKGLFFVFGVITVIMTFMPVINLSNYQHGLANFGLSLWGHYTVFGFISICFIGIAFYLNKKNF